MSEPAVRGDGVRRANLALVLRLVHERGPLPRAALTVATGLNRSTVADLVGALSRHGLVDEHSPDASGRVGRPSPVVAASPDVVAIAVNPEVDAITLAAVGLDRRIVVRERVETSTIPAPDDVSRLIASRIDAWRRDELAGARLLGIGLAVPGLVRTGDGVVRTAPHLGWRDTPLRDLVVSASGLPTRIGNDATLGTLAEHRFGAARDVAHAVYLNGGASGIGGGMVVGGHPVAGAGGYAGEFGRNRPGIADPSDRRAANGVLEDEVSRRRLLEVVGLDVADDPTLTAALTAAVSPSVLAEVARQRRILATALANAANVLNPSVVVLGGFLATLAQLDPDGLAAAVAADAMPECAEGLSIRPALLADDRLLIGAAELVFDDVIADPLPAR